MNFAIDDAQPATIPKPAISIQTDQLADMMLTRAFLDAQAITNVSAHSRKDEICVRVEQVFRTKTTVYVHYTIENQSSRHQRQPLVERPAPDSAYS